MKTKHVLSSNQFGQHRIVYQDWGDEDNPKVLLCVHGLTRNSRDFDYLAKHLSADYRIIAPDIVGRGQSDWLSDPSHYTLEQYIKDMCILIQELKVEQIDWLGTSLGGLIGMAIAARPGSPVKRLILNDIGPVIKKEAIAFLATNLEQTPHFASLIELQTFLKQAYSAMGELDQNFWEHMATYDHRITPEGRITRNFDPKITKSVGSLTSSDLALWDLWEALTCPILVLHGELSLILTAPMCEEMLARNSHASIVTLPGVGHTPSLMTEGQIQLVKDWLV